jgi:Pyridoxamine 5'-phosphate oxidase
MNTIKGVYREVIEKSEWVAIATSGPDGPHLAACWVRNLLPLSESGEEIHIPAWRFEQSEANLKRNPRMELLFVACDVERAKGDGQGCTVIGMGELLTTGPKAEANKTRFPWARGVLVVKVAELKTHLP